MTCIHFHKTAFAAALLACVTLGTAARADDSAGVARISDQTTRSKIVIRANDDVIGTEVSAAETDATETAVTETATVDGGDDVIVDGDCAGRSRWSQWWDDQVSMHYARRMSNVDGMESARQRRQCWGADQNAAYRYRNEYLNCQVRDNMRCKFGYFIPTGCCGSGCPIAGRYRMVYAVEPHYADPRDGGVYSAQGYGVPMAVPLAPNVGHTYNYSWGLPASRLTPISHVGPIPAH